MISPSTRWLLFTVVVGLIPVLVRLLAWVVSDPGAVKAFSASDLIAFGLVLHISNINEAARAGEFDLGWKAVLQVVSALFITFYGFLLAVILFEVKTVNQDYVLYSSAFLTTISFGISLAVHKQLP